MMNIFGYWDPPLWKVVLANITFWSKFVRPLGALYYLPEYHLFGLNPVPYNVVRLLLLAGEHSFVLPTGETCREIVVDRNTRVAPRFLSRRDGVSRVPRLFHL